MKTDLSLWKKFKSLIVVSFIYLAILASIYALYDHKDFFLNHAALCIFIIYALYIAFVITRDFFEENKRSLCKLLYSPILCSLFFSLTASILMPPISARMLAASLLITAYAIPFLFLIALFPIARLKTTRENKVIFGASFLVVGGCYIIASVPLLHFLLFPLIIDLLNQESTGYISYALIGFLTYFAFLHHARLQIADVKVKILTIIPFIYALAVSIFCMGNCIDAKIAFDPINIVTVSIICLPIAIFPIIFLCSNLVDVSKLEKFKLGAACLITSFVFTLFISGVLFYFWQAMTCGVPKL